MKKGSGTRSGLLWEVERILDECAGELPHVLLMENVPQVIGKKNIEDFQLWRDKLEKLGYSNYVQLLNAKDYGIPQNRERCFMVSVLGDWNYGFPAKQPLKLRLKDLLEESVDDKYTLSKSLVEYFVKNTEKQRERGNGFKFETVNEKHIGKTRTTNPVRMDNNFIAIPENTKIEESANGIIINASERFQHGELNGLSRTLMSGGAIPGVVIRKEFAEHVDSKTVLIPENTKKGFAVAQGGGRSVCQSSSPKTRNSPTGNDSNTENVSQ